MSSETAGLVFLSWVRTGLGATVAGVDPLTGPIAARGAVTVAVRLNERPEQQLTARIHGPGDVTGLDARQIIRTDPVPGAHAFEPNYLASIEFDRPDLPWCLTPARADEQGRLRPWLVLVVVEADNARVEPRDGAPLAALICAREELPDLGDSWAWAHAQLTGEAAMAQPIGDALREAPQLSLSRLVSSRRLLADRRYLACVVPAFEAGRRTGLGLVLDPADEQALRPAWTPGSGEIELPVYYSWRFATGPDGDFEALVRRLEARPMPPTLGLRDMDVGHPGGGLPDLSPDAPGSVLGLEGALRGPATVPSPWDEAARGAFQAEMQRLLERPAGRLAPPVYGAAHAGPADDAGPQPKLGDAPRWLRELNLDPRHRAAAAFGTRVVQQHQETLVASAWDQAARLREVNEALRQGQLARTAATSLHRRRLRIAGDDGPATERLLQLTAAAHGDLSAGANGDNVADLVARNEEVTAALTPAFRRITRPLGPLARRLTPGRPLPPPVTALATRALKVAPPPAPPAGMYTDETTFRRLEPQQIQTPWWNKPAPDVAETAAPATPTISSVGAPMPNRTWAVAEGRVYSFVPQGAGGGWIDHGAPPGTTARNAPTAIKDLRVYVNGSDGTLRQLAWDGDRWAWNELRGLPPTRFAEAPTAVRWTGRPLGGEAMQSGEFDEVFAVGADGHLYADAGYTDVGTPPGTLVSGCPGLGGWWQLLVTGTNGHLYECQYSGERWVWTDKGGPLGARLTSSSANRPVRLADGSPVAMVEGGGWARWQPAHWITVIIGTPGMKTRIPVPAGWGRLGKVQGDDIGGILGVTTGGALWLASASGPRVYKGLPSEPWAWTSYSIPGAPADSRPSGAAADGTVVVNAGGRLNELIGETWHDRGPPDPGGRGAPDARPPAHRRWRPAVGFMSNVVVAHADNPGGANTAHVRLGREFDFDAVVQGGWDLKSPMPGTIGEDTQGLGVAVGDINGSGKPDLLVFWVERLAPSGGNFGCYRIGWDLDAAGKPAGGWSDVRRVPTPMITTIASGGALTASFRVTGVDVALADIDEKDGCLELIVAYATEPRVLKPGGPSQSQVYYRIGWSLDAQGLATRGWTESQEVMPRPAGTAEGVGVAVVDVDGDLRPEIVVLSFERVVGGGPLEASYRIGWGLNARGLVIGREGTAERWSRTAIGGGPLPGAIQGGGLAVADFSGSQRPDLVVFWIENGPTDNYGWYRVGFDVGFDGLHPGVAHHWSEDRRVHSGGWWGWENQGGGVAVTSIRLRDGQDSDIDRDLINARSELVGRFCDAATAQQAYLQRVQRLAAAEDAPALSIAELADDVHEQLDPERTVTQRTLARLPALASLPGTVTDPLNPLAVVPSFPQPMSGPLAQLSQDLILPGVEHVPPETATLLRANEAFIEAYMVGLNHEFARELLWREYPTDRHATFFRQFWDTRGAVATTGPLTDIPSIRDWPAAARLGESATAVGGRGMIILLVRGEVLRRYPGASVFAQRAAWSDTARTTRILDAERREPQFHGELQPDLRFFGFPLTVAEALGAGPGAGWFFVLRQQPTSPRFGADQAPLLGPFGSAPAFWSDLHWGALAPSSEKLQELRHVPLAAPFGAATATVRKPAPGEPPGPKFTWAYNAAHTAHITLQPPMQIVIHATDMLPEHVEGSRITEVVKREHGSPQVRIRAISGTYEDGSRWRLTTAQAIEAIRDGWRFYVEQPVGDRVYVLVSHTADGRAYLRTEADGDIPNNLLALPALPDA